MLGISFGEIFLVVLVALFLFKPQELKSLLPSIKHFITQLKDMNKNISKILSDMYQEIDNTDMMNKILGDDGQYYESYDVSELNDLSKNHQKVNKSGIFSENDKQYIFFLDAKNTDDEYTLH